MLQTPEFRTRVLVLAPTGRDATAAVDQLRLAGLTGVVCTNVLDLIGKLNDGAAVAIIAEEAFRSDLANLRRWVEKQPPWSDFPFVVITTRGLYPKEDTLRLGLIETLGNVSLLERPLSAVSLMSAVQS